MPDYLFDRPGIFQRNNAFLIWNTTLGYSHTQSVHLDSYQLIEKQKTLDLCAAYCLKSPMIWINMSPSYIRCSYRSNYEIKNTWELLSFCYFLSKLPGEGVLTVQLYVCNDSTSNSHLNLIPEWPLMWLSVNSSGFSLHKKTYCNLTATEPFSHRLHLLRRAQT